jgi:hypothetical protein
MTTTTVPKTGLTNEPVLVGAGITWLLSLLGTVIIGHTHLLSSGQWSTLSTTLVPIISAVVLSVVGYVTRKFVTPAWKIVTSDATKAGIPDSFIRSITVDEIDKALSEFRSRFPRAAATVAAVEPLVIPAPPAAPLTPAPVATPPVAG